MSKYKTTMSDLMLTIESKKALDKKAKKSGMPKGILSKVYDRGMAAWKGGHRPGTTPQQWALARVNSFITKSSGTWGGADKDLAKQVRGEEFDLELEEHLEDLELQERAPRKGDYQVNSQKKDTPIKNIDHFATKQQADAFAAKVKKDGGKVDSITKLEAVEEKMKHISFDKARPQLPPHLKKLFDKDGNFINPKSQAVFDKMVKDAGGFDGLRKKYNITNQMDHTEVEECWSTHKQVGTKMKGGKRVPNCVPKSEARQLKDKDKEMMIVKHNRVIVIDKSDWEKYKSKGYKLAEELDENVVSNTSGKNNSKSRIDEKTVPKDKDTDQPKKYVSGLSDKDKKAHDKHLEKGSKKADDDKSAYKQSPADKKAKTKPSVHTKKFKQMYGETKELLEFSAAQIKTLEKEYAPLKGKRMSPDQLNKMMGMIKRMSKDQLNKLAQASIPFVTSTAKSELVINRGMKWTDFKEGFKVEDVEDVAKLTAEVEKLKKEKEELEKKASAASQDKSAPIPNPDTGEVPLKVGLAQAILKLKKDARKSDEKMKMTGKKIMKMAREHFMMEDVGDQAKALGLDYMNFGRYGKDGKVTHKSVSGKLQPVKGDDDKKSDKKSKDSDDDKSPESVDLKARKFMSDLEKGKLKDDDLGTIEIDFEDENSITAACDAARDQGLDDLAMEIEDEVGSYTAEMEPEEAEAGFRKIVSKYSGKPDRAVEMAKKSNEAISMMTDTEYDEVQPFLSDLNATMDMLKTAVNSDKTTNKFNPEVIGALQNTREVLGDVRDFAEVGDEDDLDLFDELDGEIEYMADENEDHDRYTKQSKVISSVETAQKIIKKLIKRTKDYEIKEATNIAKKEDDSNILTFKDLKKKLDISDIQKILPDKKKKDMKLSKEKTKIEIDPKMDISPSAGGDPKTANSQ